MDKVINIEEALKRIEVFPMCYNNNVGNKSWEKEINS